MDFEWDPPKERANVEKHGVTFVEATTVFASPLSRIVADEEHSFGERREIITGYSLSGQLLLICFTERTNTASGSSAPGEPGRMSASTMSSMSLPRPTISQIDELAPEYRFDYSKAKPNRFAGRMREGSMAIMLDPDVASVFQDAEAVNRVLRALLTTMPAPRKRAAPKNSPAKRSLGRGER